MVLQKYKIDLVLNLEFITLISNFESDTSNISEKSPD